MAATLTALHDHGVDAPLGTFSAWRLAPIDGTTSTPPSCSWPISASLALIAKLHDGGVVVMPSIGAKRHAEKVLDWGVDAVIVQGGEGGGHTGSVPTTLLLPQVVDAVQGRVLVIAAGGFFDGRGLVAALAYGADGIAMGTRFLLTADSPVPARQGVLPAARPSPTPSSPSRWTAPHRVLRTELVEELESARGKVWRCRGP